MKSKYEISNMAEALSRQSEECEEMEDHVEAATKRAQDEVLSWVTGLGCNPLTGDDDPGLKDEGVIRAMIAELKAHREDVPERSAFGDPNWKQTDAQVEILEWALADTPAANHH